MLQARTAAQVGVSLCTSQLPKGLLLSLKNILKSFSSSTRAGLQSVWILSKSCRCLSYFLLEFDGIIKGYCCHSKEVCSWSHFLLLRSNVNRLNLTALITRRVHFKARNFLFLLFLLYSEDPQSSFRCHFLIIGCDWHVGNRLLELNTSFQVHAPFSIASSWGPLSADCSDANRLGNPGQLLVPLPWPSSPPASRALPPEAPPGSSTSCEPNFRSQRVTGK